MRFTTVISSVLLISGTTFAGGLGVENVRRRYEELASRRRGGIKGPDLASHDKVTARGDYSGPMFLSANTTKFGVNGTAVPEVDFDIGESYAGSLPISSKPDEESNLFFWFFPSKNPAASKEIVIWLNGGPGCSSFEGLLQENGPFLWQYGTYKPVSNPWGWSTLTNMIWVEQPVGTGFSTGAVTARSEEDVAAQFNGFWRNFVDTFGLHGYKVYIAGESYAGLYCPYIASAMLNANDTTYFDMSGLMIYDPVITEDDFQEPIPTVQFIDYWTGLFPFNDTFRADIHARDKKCGYSAYVEEYLVYPPKGPQPQPKALPGRGDPECEGIFYDVIEAATLINPCFNIYQVSTTCPVLWDVLGFPGSIPFTPEGTQVYFNRTDVKNAIHAPLNVDWALCAELPVFTGRDRSAPSIHTALPHVIDATKNVIIGHGALDMVLLANGTLLGIQNMTWGGKLGFQNRPTQPFYVPASSIANSLSSLAAEGVFGTVITERGLTYIGVALSGHMIPQYAPSAAYRQLEFLLGRVNCLNCTVPFTTDAVAAPQNPQPLGDGTTLQEWSNTGEINRRSWS